MFQLENSSAFLRIEPTGVTSSIQVQSAQAGTPFTPAANIIDSVRRQMISPKIQRRFCIDS